MKLRLSKSKFLQYKYNCPRQYYFDNFTDYGKQRATNVYMVFGSMMHEYFEEYNKNAESAEFYREALVDEEPYKEHIINFEKILEKFGLDRAEVSELKIYDPEKDFVAIVDAIYKKDGEYILVDYKTGRYFKQDKNKYIQELLLYVDAIERSTDMKISKIGMFFTAYPDDSFIQDVDRNKIQETLADLDEVRRRIENCEFPRNKSVLCAWCDYREVCEGYRDEIIVD